jgi:drug/metabolite transporter (DMT)-like permease
LLVFGAAVLWSTGGLFIKAIQLSAFELSFGRSLLAAITIAIFTRREGFGINKISVITSILYAALIILFVLATKMTTAANAIFLQYTAPVYVLLLEPIFYKEKFRGRDFITVALCVGGMSLFFVASWSETSVAISSLASGVCFAVFLRLHHGDVNRASSANLRQPDRVRYAGFWVRSNAVSAYRLCLHCLSGDRANWFYFSPGHGAGVRSLRRSLVHRAGTESCLGFYLHRERPSGWAMIGGLIIITSVISHTLIEIRAKRRQKVSAELEDVKQTVQSASTL